MYKRQIKAPTSNGHDFTQTVVPEPSFRRGAASVMDIRGTLFVVNSKGGRFGTKGTAATLRADRKRIAADFAAVKPSRAARHGMEQLAAKIEAVPKR
ncbi:MAG: hypothetical protein ACRDJH_21425 [Thermomicrobiales bacterium]